MNNLLLEIERANDSLGVYIARKERERQMEECRQARRREFVAKIKETAITIACFLIFAGVCVVGVRYILWFFSPTE